MSTARRLKYTYGDYLRALEESQIRLEYCDGDIHAMAGGTATHAELAIQVAHALKLSLPPTCRVFSSDLRVRIEASDLTTFPDLTVVCGKRESSDRDRQAIVNPSLLVEVTSRSTEDYDRGDKLSHYRQLPSLRAVLFVSHRTRRLTLVERTADGWVERDLRGGETLVLDAPPVRLAVDDVYSGVELEDG